jgi:hypothetical protein
MLAVGHHAATNAPDDADRQALIVILPRRDVIERGLGEEAGPAIELPVIQRMGVVADQRRDHVIGRRLHRQRCDLSGVLGHGQYPMISR